MEARLFQLASFTTKRFAGNPAAVMLFDHDPSAERCQALAAENNLARMAFLVPQGEDYRIRWFTPAVEVPAGLAMRWSRLRRLVDTSTGPLSLPGRTSLNSPKSFAK